MTETLSHTVSATVDATTAFPLNILSHGEEGVVIRLAGTEELRRRLVEQGVIPGARLQLVHTSPETGVVVRIGETRLMLGRSTAGRVFVRPAGRAANS